jgi:Family of unknown function (DUF6301)
VADDTIGGVGPARVLSAAQIGELAARLAAARWDWSTVTVAGIADALGWELLATGPGGGILGAGLAAGNGYADVFTVDGSVGAVELPLTDPISGTGPGPTGERRDAFALAVRAVSEALGPPARRRPGQLPECRWSVPGGVLRVGQDSVFVEMALLSPEYADELAAEPADDAGLEYGGLEDGDLEDGELEDGDLDGGDW